MRSLRLFLLPFSSLLPSFSALPRLSFAVISDFETVCDSAVSFARHLTSLAKRLSYPSYFFANGK